MTLAALANQPVPAVRPARQQGAYALIGDDAGRVLVVEAGNGRFYLPGGRIEVGESATEALAREMVEECGWHIEIVAPVWQSEQAIFDGTVRLTASYWTARLGSPSGTQAEHGFAWFTPAEAVARLHRDSDRRAIAAFVA